MSEKSCLILISKLLYKMSQDFLDIKYNVREAAILEEDEDDLSSLSSQTSLTSDGRGGQHKGIFDKKRFNYIIDFMERKRNNREIERERDR